jgi:hypothetical protein
MAMHAYFRRPIYVPLFLDELTCWLSFVCLQRAMKRLKKLNMRMRKGGSCWGIVLSVIAAVICVAVVWALIAS